MTPCGGDLAVCGARSIISLEKELESLGGKVAATRGGMIHLILSLCRQFEDAFAKAIDGGKGGARSRLSPTSNAQPALCLTNKPFACSAHC